MRCLEIARTIWVCKLRISHSVVESSITLTTMQIITLIIDRFVELSWCVAASMSVRGRIELIAVVRAIVRLDPDSGFTKAHGEWRRRQRPDSAARRRPMPLSVSIRPSFGSIQVRPSVNPANGRARWMSGSVRTGHPSKSPSPGAGGPFATQPGDDRAISARCEVPADRSRAPGRSLPR